MRFVIDASAAVEVLLQTSVGSRVAQTIRDADLVAPELLDVETVSAIWRLVRRGQLSERRAAEALEDLQRWPLTRLPHGELIKGVWSVRHNVSIYDAFYVAAARQRGATVLTADGPLSRAPAAGVTIQNVRG